MSVTDEDFPGVDPSSGSEEERPAPDEPGTDPTERDFGPEPDPRGCPGAGTGTCSAGPIPGVACGGEACFLRPFASLAQNVFVHLSQNHPGTLRHVTASGIEFLKAVREFIDEEIALAERVRAAQGGQRFHKIHID